MDRPWKFLLIAASVSVGASAHTAVTTSGGTAYNIPAFNGTASLGRPPIDASGGNVGIPMRLFISLPQTELWSKRRVILDSEAGTWLFNRATELELLALWLR